MAIPRPGPSVTTTNMTNKGFRCAVCFHWRPIVTRDTDGRSKCDACIPESRRGPVSLAPTE